MKLHDSVTHTRIINRFNTLEADFRAIHGDKYSYEKVVYIGALDKITITCPKHGDFTQTPSNHLKGQGCKSCQYENMTSSTDEFIEKAIEVHGDRYSYEKVVYVNALTKIIITCPKHGDFLQRPSSHLQGMGCNSCALEETNYSTYVNRPTKLYFVKVTNPDNQTYFKIGVTLESVERRYYKEISKGYQIATLIEHEFKNGFIAYLLEQKLIRENKHLRPKLRESFLYRGIGDTELLTEDISENIQKEIERINNGTT
jgi:hypothetical protein